MKKISAVEWFSQELQKHFELFFPGAKISELMIEQAKEMEKEQSIKDYSIGYGNGQVNSNRTAKQYYNETYGKDKSET
jgi:hypothetical protein